MALSINCRMFAFTFHSGKIQSIIPDISCRRIMPFTFHFGKIQSCFLGNSGSLLSSFTFHFGKIQSDFPEPDFPINNTFTFHFGKIQSYFFDCPLEVSSVGPPRPEPFMLYVVASYTRSAYTGDVKPRFPSLRCIYRGFMVYLNC